MITCIYDYISKNKCIKCMILMHEIACYQYSKEKRLIRLHQQMGHPPFDLLKSCYPLLFNGVVSKQLSCEACNMAKL